MEVEVIKANNPFDESAKIRKTDRLRVAAYCRVSTDDEDQIKSYNSMVKYYTELIKNNNQWVFAGVYADKAITGTKVDKREDFQRLIQDCMDGKIDMVIAKSLPRFARNTLDTLKYVRMLKEKGIAVYFEVEKINTMKDGEFLMTILSSVAQQEVENTSAYVKKGLKMKMKRGELVGFQGCLGYDYDVATKSLSINAKGAETVRYIFDRYVAGAGSTMIARELNEQGITTIKGNPWTTSSVMGIINNEKYKGDILLGKTFTVDPISKRRLENLGEEDRFYIRNHHEPIISEETFARAQEIRERRNGGRKSPTPGKREKYSRQYAFSCMLECGFCGASLSRRRWHSSSKYKKTIWQCVKSTKSGKRYCPDSKGIPEQVIEEAFIESYKMLCSDNKDVLEEFITRVEKTSSEDMPQKTRDSVNYLVERHYTLNSNFEVTSDSLMLQQLPLVDVLPVFKGERLVVAEFMIQAADSVDSVWVKVARDQETMGWIHEKELLEKVVPVDSVSQFIHFFSNSHTIAFFVILGFFGIWYIHRAIRRQKLQLIWLNDIDSVFPTVLSWLVATAATLYASIQHFVPGTWEQFYYNPSLNPFSLPFILSLFMFNIWGIILVGLATLDDLFHQTHIEAACFYLLGLMSL